jgi:hypothetical protein
MRKLSLLILAAALAATMTLAGTAHAGKPTIGKPCVQCHKGQPDVVRGKMGARSEKFSTINVHVGNLVWVIGYDEKTGVEGAKSLEAIPKGKEIAVTFTDGEKAHATVISVKQPYTVPEEQLASLGYMKNIVERGPKVGGYLLVDARPRPKYLEGHIPDAVSMPYALFDRMHGMVLPENKDLPVIFYCGGTT